MRELTESERVTIINAVQTLVGRLDRAIPGDARQVAYKAAADLFTHEYRLRYAPQAPPPEDYIRAVAPPPPVFYPPVPQRLTSRNPFDP